MQVSVASWSVNRRFRCEDNPLKLLDYPQLVVDEFGINAVELNSPFFEYEDPDDPGGSSIATGYVTSLAKAADDAGCAVLGIAVDKHGDLAAKDRAERHEAVENHRKWFDICAVLGAQYFRANSGGRDNPSDPRAIDACTESFGELARIGEDYGIVVVMENHWGISQNPNTMVRIAEEVNSDYFQLLADFLNWPEEYDKVQSLTKIAPYTFTTHAKFKSFDDTGECQEIDAAKVMNIFKAAGYDRAFTIEYEGSGPDGEGVLKSKALLEKYAY